MFDLFFLQCKTEIYKSRFLKQPWYAIVLLLLLIAASLGMFVSSFIFQNAACTLICCGIMLLLTLFVAYLDHRRNKQANTTAVTSRSSRRRSPLPPRCSPTFFPFSPWPMAWCSRR